MAQANIYITPYAGTEKEDFAEFELQLRGAIAVAGLAADNQAKFLRLHLRDNALRYYITLPEATKTNVNNSLTELKQHFERNEVAELSLLKLENMKFNSKTDTVENFLVKLKNQAEKAYPTPVINVVPAGGGAADAEVRREERENAARDATIATSNERKNAQIKRIFIKAMPNWLKPKLLNRPVGDTADDLCT